MTLHVNVMRQQKRVSMYVRNTKQSNNNIKRSFFNIHSNVITHFYNIYTRNNYKECFSENFRGILERIQRILVLYQKRKDRKFKRIPLPSPSLAFYAQVEKSLLSSGCTWCLKIFFSLHVHLIKEIRRLSKSTHVRDGWLQHHCFTCNAMHLVQLA